MRGNRKGKTKMKNTQNKKELNWKPKHKLETYIKQELKKLDK